MTYSAKLTGKRCGCPTCREAFSTVGNFDKHRKGKPGEKVCVNPAECGLAKRFVSSGYVWVTPRDEGDKYEISVDNHDQGA